MAKFTSRYSELGFYVGGSLRRFKNGIYVTDEKEEIAVLERTKNVVRIDEPKEEKPEKKAEEVENPKQKAEAVTEQKGKKKAASAKK